MKLELVSELVMDQKQQEVESLEKEQRYRHLHHLGALLRQPGVRNSLIPEFASLLMLHSLIQPVSWQGGLEELHPCHHDPQVGAEGLRYSP